MVSTRSAIVFALVLLAAACTGSEDTTDSLPTDPAPTDTLPTDPAPTDSLPTDTLPTDTQPTDTGPGPDEDLECAAVSPGVTEFSTQSGDANHDVRVFVPSDYTGATLLPTVLNWHGLGSDGPGQARYTAYETLAETEKFMVVHATGVPDPGTTSNSWELIDEQDPTRDDLVFANELIDTLIADFCADPVRIYSTGMSNGGLFTARLVCNLADRIAAASSVAGVFHQPDCEPSRPVPYQAYHGTSDLIIPFNGGGRSFLIDPTNADPRLIELFERVIPDAFAEFAADANCDDDPVMTEVGDDVIRYDYEGCDEGVPMSFFEVVGGGHTWPNSPIAAGLLGKTTTAVDATADSWAFFEEQVLPTP